MKTFEITGSYVAEPLMLTWAEDSTKYKVGTMLLLCADGGVRIGDRHFAIDRPIEVNIERTDFRFTRKTDSRVLSFENGVNKRLFVYKYISKQRFAWVELIASL
ncbi:hypothetical protein Poly59_40670 [Rubripirellula reticaptiva]|uniref:Uncharacterized protein n=1 Tax=Rubripirellula reticaptiva TaxID=2528013 RepID=A0A5C6EK58_9BACT|nr:hypothetical protein Poly59_40670 [Rubripirellula reticaptiva]